MSKYYDNYGHKDKQQLKKGYSYSQGDGGEEVYTQPGRKARWKNMGPNVVNKRIEASKGYSIYKVPEKKAPAPQQAPAKPAVPKEQSQKIEPVIHSPEIQQAKERVAKYQDNILSGETTDEIFTSSKPQQATQSFLDKQAFQFNQDGYNKL